VPLDGEVDDPMPEGPAPAERDELLRLLEHYEGAFRTHLDLTHKYFSIYLTLMIVVLGGALAAVAQPGPTEDVIAVAPLTVCALAVLCRRVVVVFYRRHVEAWMTTENIRAVLGLTSSRYGVADPDVLPFRSAGDPDGDDPAVVVNWERPTTRRRLRTTRSVDDVMRYFVRHSDVMRAVDLTLAVLLLAGLATALSILLGGP
jgi:hypothetical protein